jgi:hypothetical protein
MARHVRSVEFFCYSRPRVWRARGIPNSAGGHGEGPGFFAWQTRARMTEQDQNCHYDLQSSIGASPAPATQSPGASRERPAGDRQVAGRVRVPETRGKPSRELAACQRLVFAPEKAVRPNG